MKFCPMCSAELAMALIDGVERLSCPAAECQFVHWDNPTPVVAAIVEYEGKVVMSHNVSWPEHFYSINTGFLERGEEPQEGTIREVKEELNLDTTAINFVGLYSFPQMNQLIIAYHVQAQGTIRLNEELDDYKLVEREDIRTWPMGTGLALEDWLRAQGIEVKQISR